MDYSFPLLRKVTEHYASLPHDVGELYLVCCQHMLEPQKHMFEELISFGFDPSKILLLGKTYSTNLDVYEELKDLGIQAVQPAFSGRPFDEEHEQNCRDLLKRVPEGAGCIVLDDGAQLIQLAVESKANVWFAVEQTSSGFRKLEKTHLPFPVLNVARSATKLNQESPFIARHACDRMKDYFFEKELIVPRVLVIGLGPIGESVKQYFEQDGFNVQGFDIKEGHSDLMSTILEYRPNVIIGATGTSVLSAEDARQLVSEEPLYLISMSSSDREFPAAQFREGNTSTHVDITYKNLTFVNNGFPISFKGNRYESLPIEMEKTMCLLGGSVIYGATIDHLEPGLQELPEELERLVNS